MLGRVPCQPPRQPPRVRSNRVQRAIGTLLLALGLGLGVTACGGSSSTPQATLHAFVSAWRQRDWPAVRRQILNPPADFTALNADTLTALGVTSPRLAAGPVRKSGSSASARVTQQFVIPQAGTWTTATTVKLTDHHGHWLVSWTPATINPALSAAGDRLLTTRDWPRRAAILGAGGASLTTQHPLVTVGVVGSRIKNARAVGADLVAAGATRSEANTALTAAKAHPTYFEPVFQVSRARFEELKRQPGANNVYAVPGTQFQLLSDRAALTPQLGAHVVGTVGPITAQQLAHLGSPYNASSTIGQTGLEQAYERRLAGTPTTRVVVIDATGATTRTVASFPGTTGRPVQTSLDPAVQRAAESALSGVRKNAAMVVMRASTGQILAVVSDPVSYGYDQALQGAYPPGSTFKVLTSAALIRAGLSPQSPASCPPSLTVDGEVFHNAEGEGAVQTLSEAFTESCNTAFVGLATSHLKPHDFTSTATLFGLDPTPKPGLPAFDANVPAPTSTTALAATAIGQAQVTFSPLGMAGVAAAIASGSVHAARLVSGAPDDSVAPRPLPANVLAGLRPMMADVASSGTAANTGLPAGTHAKTGTAQYYAQGKLHTDAWLMGYHGDIAFALVVQDTDNINGGPLDGPLVARFFSALGSQTRR
jgi:cell division protein FtsI/penicillin-binding protein 2